jgi:hypothetical protein
MAAPEQNPAAPRPVVVLGMHRSGTSLCANLLHAMGVNMAEHAAPSPHNQRGHWERAPVNDLNDRIFDTFGRAWDSAAHVLALPPHWLGDPRVQAVRAALVAYLRPLKEWGSPWGLKDPRIARLLPLWRQVFADLEISPRYVFCIRDPAQVARSLTARDDLAREQAEYRWLVYNADAVTGLAAAPVCVIPYEHWFDHRLETASRLAAWAGRPPPTEATHALIDPTLRHDAPEPETARPLARRLHHLLQRNTSAGRLDADVQNLCTCLAEFEQQVQPLLVETEILRSSVTAQNRVIADLTHEIRQLRRAA